MKAPLASGILWGKFLLVIGFGLMFCVAYETAFAGMTIQSLNGPVTATEISSFKSFMSGESPPGGQTYDNSLADGTPGMEAEALGLMYEVTNDPALLNQLILYSDQFLALRNNTNNGQIMWDGSRDPVWLTKPPTNSNAGYAGCENNDIVGHIAYCAKLILENHSLWNTTVPDGDPHGNGATYIQRAHTYIAQMDLVQDDYMLKWFINPTNYQIVAPTNAAWTALGESVNPYNRQMMFLNGFQRLSECHQLLNDNPARVAEYDNIVKAAMNGFFSAVQPYTTNGIPVYNWTYAPGSGGSEDNTLHSTYDIWGVTRAWQSGRYGLVNSEMVPLANTLQYVMNVSTNHISYYVNGTSSPNSPRNFIYPGWMPAANFGAETFPIMANMDIAQGSQASTAIFDALILWVKNARSIGLYPTNAAGVDFTISTPWMENVVAGSNVVCTITLNPLSGFTHTVTLAISNLPAELKGNFSPVTLTNGSGSSTLTISASNNVSGGICALANNVVVLATSGGGTRATEIVLVIRPRPTILSAKVAGSTITLAGTNGFAGATFNVLSSTNLAQPLSKWPVIATNIFETNGNFSVSFFISSNKPACYYSLEY